MATDDDDVDLEVAPPRVRPVRMVVAAALSVLALVGALMSWFVVHPSRPPPEAQGSAAVIGRSLTPIVTWPCLVLCGLVAVIAAVTFAMALREARAARAASPT
ncbi:MAG: hypothetical protein JNK64_24110 [Myxococcales bacterium]|nr:hypothetical protein [Myxococcales bacterium]